jgi:CRP-like cAMP-binding protein
VEGNPRDVMYIILDGEVDIQHRDRSIYTVGPGETVDELAMIDGQGRSATAEALNPCRLAVVDEKQLLFMVQETPNLALDVRRVLGERLRRHKRTSTTA